MAGVHSDQTAGRPVLLAAMIVVLLLGGSLALSQAPSATAEGQVAQVRVVGNRQNPVEEIVRHIRTRAGRAYDSELIEEDVRRLNKTRLFVDVKAYYQQVPGGRIVIFEVVERPILHYVKYVGNEQVPKTRLQKEVDIKEGDSLDPFSVDEGRRRLEKFYHEKGFSKARITVVEGNKPTDRGATYYINEGPKQRFLWTHFEGNRIASDAKLRTKIQSKPGFFWFIKGEVNRDQIDEDRKQLEEYYRSLGFFRARIGHPLLNFDQGRNWLVLTYVIDEGPRYRVRNVSFIGNTRFNSESLVEEVKLKAGEAFNQDAMNADLATVRSKYGAIGYVFSKVEAEPRFFEEPGELDLVYNIQEGARYRVGMIYPQIKGEFPHTRLTTVLNRLSLVPGDIVDTRELKASERRLRASQLFEVDPMRGVAPKIALVPPELEDMETEVARQPGRPPRFRGQSPDRASHSAFRPPQGTPPADRLINLCVQGNWIGESESGESRNAVRGSGGQLPPNPTGTIIRGQYSPEAGQSMPQLRQPEPRFDRPLNNVPSTLQSYQGQYQPAENTPAYGDQRQPFTQTPGQSNQYQEAPNRSGYDNRLQAVPQQPAYENQFQPGGYGPPAGSGGYVAPGVPPLDAASSLYGLPPNEDPALFADLYPEVYETRTGRLMFSVGVNSDAGLIGSVIVDEQNFDWRRFPTSWDEIRNGTAWRGAGQRFRAEAVPGTQVQRYAVDFQEPYLFDSRVALGLKGNYYTRRYREWDEERLGGGFSLGYQLRPDLSVTFAFRGANIHVYDPIVPQGTLTELDEVLGSNGLYGFGLRLTHDTRDNPYLATEGHLIEVGVEQVVGSFNYVRGDVDIRKYFLLREHPDHSSRHVLSLNGRMAVTSDNTPIYDHYYAGGFSTIRGFDFRGASPRDDATNVVVGGHFMLLASVEYLFPITADDNLRGVVFCDTGTVEPAIDNWTDNYRVSPGFGLRIMIPAMGAAPIALDFAFPISEEPGDVSEVFSFFIGFLR